MGVTLVVASGPPSLSGSAKRTTPIITAPRTLVVMAFPGKSNPAPLIMRTMVTMDHDSLRAAPRLCHTQLRELRVKSKRNVENAECLCAFGPRFKFVMNTLSTGTYKRHARLPFGKVSDNLQGRPPQACRGNPSGRSPGPP